jgi:hypothetical protein
MSVPKPKKTINRNVAVALGMVCVVLLTLSVGALIENMSLQNQVNDLNRIVNFQKVVTWLNNETVTINPSQNVTERFTASLGGNVEVVGSVQSPVADNYWYNLSYFVVFGGGFVTVHTIYPKPYIVNQDGDYFDVEYPIVSYGQYEYYPNVYFVIGNNLSSSSITVNLTATFTY